MNPFTPGFNRQPAFLIGRDRVIETLDLNVRYTGNDLGLQQPIMLVGPRGMGKTVLEAYLVERAVQQGWEHIHVEMRKKITMVEIVQKIMSDSRNSRWQFGDGEVTANIGLSQVAGLSGKVALHNRYVTPSLTTVLGKILSKITTGFLLTIDEMQEASKDVLQELGSAIQALVPMNPKLIVIAAGLPAIRHKVATYFERAHWCEIGSLNILQSVDLLIKTAGIADKILSPEVAASLARASGGYPFALQTLGFEAWEVSGSGGIISEQHAQIAIERTTELFTSGLFQQRWIDSSPEQREYLQAMATLLHEGNGYIAGSEIARYLQLPSTKLSSIRQRLIDKGTIIVEDNQMRFLVPLMTEWILTQEV